MTLTLESNLIFNSTANMVKQIVKPDSLNSIILPEGNKNERRNIRILIVGRPKSGSTEVTHESRV